MLKAIQTIYANDRAEFKIRCHINTVFTSENIQLCKLNYIANG